MPQMTIEHWNEHTKPKQDVIRGHRGTTPKFFAGFAVALLAAASVMPVAAAAQAAQELIPYQHIIYAGGGTSYPPVAAAGSTTTPMHGSAPGDNGPATAAGVQFANPTGMATDSLGNLYITDTAGWVRKVDTQGNISTFAGGIAAGKSTVTTICPGGANIIGDGCPANEAFLNSSRGIAIDPATGDIYIAESTGNRIRKVNHSTYMISTVVGTNTGATSTKATLATANGDLTTCSSTPGATCSNTIGLLNNVRGIAVDRHGNVYIADDSDFAIRLANFATGQLTTIANLTFTKGVGTTTCQAITNGTAGAANLGAPTDVSFDSAGNMYIADSGCSMIFKVAENPSTHMVDAGSIVTLLVGNGGSGTPTLTNQLGTSMAVTPAVVRADLQGNLYFTESTGTHVWFYDAATQDVHAIFGGGNPGDCYGAAGSGTAPYNGCDGLHSAPATFAGSAGLAFDPWGNLYISDNKSFTIHKLLLGTSAPFTVTTPAGNGNALLHFGASDSFKSISTTLAPDFAVTPLPCTTNNASGQDNTQDCPLIVANATPSSSPQYEHFTATSTLGLTSTIPVTNQTFPVCQGATAVSMSVGVVGPTAVTLSSVPGAACQGSEYPTAAPHKYSYTVTSGPSNGVLSGTAPSLTYTPNAGSTGGDSFQYTVTDTSTFTSNTVSFDGGAGFVVMETPTPLIGSTGTVTLKSNAPPVTTGQSISVNFNTAQVITLQATDADGDALTYSVVTGPANGSLGAVSGNSVTYTPATGFSGSDSFTFKANDGKSDSNVSTVSITVNPAAPAPADQTVTVPFQTATAVTLTATGTGTITYAVATQPSHGVLTGTAPNVTYTPTGSYSGSDLFTFTATNAGGSSTGTVNITVSPAPVIPVAQSQSVTVAFQTATAITLVAGGGDGNPLTYSIATTPAHGTLSAVSGANVTYTPAAGYVGADAFTFTAKDGTSTSPAATVSINVTPQPPVASGQSLTTTFGTAIAVTLSATGTGTLTYSVVAAPASGTLTGTAPNLTYTPNAGFSGTDTFTFKANNGADSNVATISIVVNAPPPPVATSQTVTTTFNTSTAITLAATGTGTISFAVTSGPSHGTLTGSAANLTYVPATGYSGSDSFTFTATNAGGPSTGTVNINVLPAPPVVSNQPVTVALNTPQTITLAAAGTGPFTFTVVSGPTHGSLTSSGAVVTYTPTTGFVGTDGFTFKANNGSDSNVATVSITVNPAPPAALSQTVAVGFNTATAVTLTATGATPFNYAVVTQPLHGTLTGTAPNLTYTPVTSFAGSDSFTFTATNSGGASNVATITLNVAGGFTWGGGSTSATVKVGQVATYNLTLIGYTGATGPVTFTVSGAPIAGTVTPSPATLNGTTPIPVTVSVMTTTNTTASIGEFAVRHSGEGAAILLLSLSGLAVLLPVARKRKLIHRLLMAFAALAIAGVATGCGTIAKTPFGTPVGNYTLTVTATAGTVTGTQTLTLTVTN